MKRIGKISVGLLVILLISCDQGLDVLNENPNVMEEVKPEYMFTSSQLNTADFDLEWLIQAMQQHASHDLGDGTSAGDRYQHNWQGGIFNGAYANQILKIQQVIELLSESPEEVNRLSIARIWRVVAFHRVTDLYGDVPYSEAGKGIDNFTPKYDTQEFIYRDMLKELEQAATALNPNEASFGNADLVYNGNINQWRQFAYSLMLRLGMRLTEIDNSLAQEWVEKAIAGGVITNNEDNAMIMYGDGAQSIERNPRANNLVNGHYNSPQTVSNSLSGKLSKTIVDYLKDTNDPRLPVYSVVRVRQQDGSFVPDNDPEIQEGMKNGTWTEQPPNFEFLSEPNPDIFMRFDTPMMFFTSLESNLLLAEAAIRGWYDQGSAEQIYNHAIREGMEQWKFWNDDAGNIPVEDVDDYLGENPFMTNGSFEDKLNQISTQKWAGLFFVDEFEIFANWRRTGFPALVPSNHPGNFTGGEIPRRRLVPSEEENLNNANWREAVERQGGNNWNNLLGRVWWDTELNREWWKYDEHRL